MSQTHTKEKVSSEIHSKDNPVKLVYNTSTDSNMIRYFILASQNEK